MAKGEVKISQIPSISNISEDDYLIVNTQNIDTHIITYRDLLNSFTNLDLEFTGDVDFTGRLTYKGKLLVSSVFGRDGDVIAKNGDYSLGMMGDVDLSNPPGKNYTLVYDGYYWVAEPPDLTPYVITVFGRPGPDIVSERGDYNLDQMGDLSLTYLDHHHTIIWDDDNKEWRTGHQNHTYVYYEDNSYLQGNTSTEALIQLLTLSGDIQGQRDLSPGDTVIIQKGSRQVNPNVSYGVYTYGGSGFHRHSCFDPKHDHLINSVFGRTGHVTAQKGDYSLSLMKDVTLGSLKINEFLSWNGSKWVNREIQFPATISTLKDLKDTDISSPALDDVITWNGAKWENKPITLPLEMFYLNKLQDVGLIHPKKYDFLMYNGTEWINEPISIRFLNDIFIPGIEDGQTIIWNSNRFVATWITTNVRSLDNAIKVETNKNITSLQIRVGDLPDLP